jgi:beta-glucosidase
MRTGFAARVLVAICLAIAGTDTTKSKPALPVQPVLGHRSVALIAVDGLKFKDLARTGNLERYEDWRLPAEARADDLVKRLSLEEVAGLMVHGTLPSRGALATLGAGQEYDLEKIRPLIRDKHVTSFITRLVSNAEVFTHQNNEVQALAEAERWGIPVTISTDPRHHFQQVLGAGARDQAFSQ